MYLYWYQADPASGFSSESLPQSQPKPPPRPQALAAMLSHEAKRTLAEYGEAAVSALEVCELERLFRMKMLPA